MTRFFTFLLILLLPFSAKAEDLDYTAFRHLPVQHEGRIKPVDTFARAFLDLCSGHQSLNGQDAEAWLAETLFDPAQALHRPIFKIFRPSQLNLPDRKGNYYSYAELAPALQQRAQVIGKLLQSDEKKWNEDQRELVRLFDAAGLYTQLLRSLSFALPLNVNVPLSLTKAWKLTEELPFTLQTYQHHSRDLQERMKQIIRKKGDDPAKYSAEEQQIAQFAMDMQILEQAGQNAAVFRIIPGKWGAAKEEWQSPWTLAESGQGSPENAEYLKLWQDMADAYQNRDPAAWKAATHAARDRTKSFSSYPLLVLEVLYNQVSPLTLASLLYLLTFFLIVYYSIRPNGHILRLSYGAMLTGGLFHAAAIIVRVVLLERPPVGTLYESVIFVALVCVLIAALLEKIRKDGQGILIGAIAGLVLLFIGQSFAAEDTMQMLVAVLNTNFWLSTHVLCITMGYGLCIIVSLLAHFWLVKKAFHRPDDKLLPAIKTTALVALLFTSVGTILGGIWADQSWGRFWGWDPKENGALLIVLWLLWALHGQISGHLKRVYYVTALAALSIVVALAWFGVNLLSIGLHSYGFITGVAASLFGFIALELFLLTFLNFRILRGAEREPT